MNELWHEIYLLVWEDQTPIVHEYALLFSVLTMQEEKSGWKESRHAVYIYKQIHIDTL